MLMGEAGASRCDLLPLLLRTTTSTRGLLGRYHTHCFHSLLPLLLKPGDLKVLQVCAVQGLTIKHPDLACHQAHQPNVFRILTLVSYKLLCYTCLPLQVQTKSSSLQ
jgi:hypothetical protein